MNIELPPRCNKSWIQTYTGRQFWPLNPRPEDIDIRDVAHALALQCRYTGHVKKHYSIAQHSVLASWNCPQEPMWALLHDASEAYLCDVARPIKPYLGEYKAFEQNLERVIAERFGLSWPMPDCIKEIDLVMLATERRDLLNTPPIGCHWISTQGITPLEKEIFFMPCELAEELFLTRFQALGGKL